MVLSWSMLGVSDVKTASTSTPGKSKHTDGVHVMMDEELLEDGAEIKRGGQQDHYKTLLSLPK